MWGKIIIPMYRLWLNGLYGLYGPRCPLSSKRPINLISLSLSFGRGRFQMHENVCILIQIFKFLQGDPNGTKSELVQTNCSKHCLNHCWSWFIMPHGINMPQWLKYEGLNGIFKYMFSVQKFYMLNDIWLNFVSKGLFGCTWTWVSLMDWHHADGKPLLITRPGCVLVMAVWWHTSGSNSTLAQVMAWCRQAWTNRRLLICEDL